MKVVVAHPGTVVPDFGIPVAEGIPPKWEHEGIVVPDDGYVVVRECWDGISVYAGPLTQAQVDAIPECGTDPDLAEQAAQWQITDALQGALSFSAPAQVHADIAALRTFAQIAAPTTAQTAVAVKAQSRLLAALARKILR